MTSTIRIVPATDSHRPLMLDAFWREYSECPLAHGVPPSVLTRKLEALLDSRSWTALVATPDDDEDSVMGYIVYRDSRAAGWLHVLRPFRKRGVARALLAHAGITPGVVACAFLPPEVAKAASAKGWTLRFRPYLPDVAGEETARRVALEMELQGLERMKLDAE